MSRLFTNIESYVVRYVKEQVGEVSLDFQEEMTSSPKAIEVDIEKFNLPDEKKYVIVFVRLYSDFYLPLMHLFKIIACLGYHLPLDSMLGIIRG